MVVAVVAVVAVVVAGMAVTTGLVAATDQRTERIQTQE
jgi:hypothetical protein